MKASTWHRDSHGLFDFEQKANLTKDNFTLNGPTKFLRADSQVVVVDDFTSQGVPAEAKRLASLNYSDGETHAGVFSICPAEHISDGAPLPREKYEKMFLVVKFLRQTGNVRGYRLCEGDVIRLGRAKFRVMEINGEELPAVQNSVCLQSAPNKSEELQEAASSEDEEDEETNLEGGAPCRVCLSEKTDGDNPMLAPCNCAGTMRLIHLKCLQHWLRSRLTTKASANVVSFSWKTLDCELCKKSFPSRISIQGRAIDLMDIPKPEGQYFILEGLSKERNSPKCLHVVSMNNKLELKLGRGHESELRVSDISASRCHASIRLQSGKFYLDDENSKFGTLVQVKRPVSLEMMEQVTLQIGRTLMNFTLKRPWTLIPACFRPSSSPFDLYNTTVNGMDGILLPINTGIPLTCSDPRELMVYVNPRSAAVKTKTHEHRNLMHNHNQIGVYSSCDEADQPGELEEVEVFTSLDQIQRSEEPMSLDRVLPSEDME